VSGVDIAAGDYPLSIFRFKASTYEKFMCIFLWRSTSRISLL